MSSQNKHEFLKLALIGLALLHSFAANPAADLHGFSSFSAVSAELSMDMQNRRSLPIATKSLQEISFREPPWTMHIAAPSPKAAGTCQVEEAFILKVLRDVVDQEILKKEEVSSELESQLEALWDLCVDDATAQAVVRFRGLEILLQASSSGEGRVAEAALGAVANVCSHWVAKPPHELADIGNIAGAAMNILATPDAAVAEQALRIVFTLLCCNDAPKATLWCATAVERYIFIVESSLRWGAAVDHEGCQGVRRSRTAHFGAEDWRRRNNLRQLGTAIRQRSGLACVAMQLPTSDICNMKKQGSNGGSTPLLGDAKATGLREVLGTRALVGMIFFEVAGGPYGAEPVIRKGGPFLAILGFLLIPLIWSLPIAVMTAELCSHDPHVGGKIHFVHKCWGPWVGWMNGWFNAVSNVFDVATLPAMALGYLEVLIGTTLSATQRWWTSFVLVAAAVVTNVAGVEIVGDVSYVLCIVVCLPSLVLVLIGTPELADFPAQADMQEVLWLHFLTSLMWNTSGFDDAGASAAEVRAPAKIYPKALGISVALVTALYVLPLSVGVAVDSAPERWHDGFLATVGERLGGAPLGLALSLAGFASSVAQLNALLCTSVREIICMAEQPGQPVPACLGTVHPKLQTPHIGTVLFGLVLTFTLQYHFVELIAATVIFDCVSFIIQFATWIRFRWETPVDENAEAFRLPVGFTGVLLWSSGPVLLSALVLFLTLSMGGPALYGTILTFVVGEAMYLAYAAKRRWEQR
eukprot:s211_g24.t1